LSCIMPGATPALAHTQYSTTSSNLTHRYEIAATARAQKTTSVKKSENASSRFLSVMLFLSRGRFVVKLKQTQPDRVNYVVT
jgi:hypothetical protein